MQNNPCIIANAAHNNNNSNTLIIPNNRLQLEIGQSVYNNNLLHIKARLYVKYVYDQDLLDDERVRS